MISNPTITVYCDRKGCKYEESFGLTPLARGAYDERDLASDMRKNGWKKINGEDICEDCFEEMQQEEQAEQQAEVEGQGE